ncbi:MAG: SLC13 family permease [Candidatus Bathyarchaeota archaeon]
MDGKLAVEAIFAVSCAAMIYLVLRKPSVHLSLGPRRIKLDTYYIGALLGPTLLIASGLVNQSQIVRGLQGEGGLNPFGVLVLFLSMVFISIYLDITGFFEFCARLALKFAGGDGRRLFFSLYIIVSILTVFTSNDIVILTFTPFVYYFSKNADIDPKPYLIAEFFAANTWSMMLYIGNPTNILLASAFGLRFDQYLRWMFWPALAAGFVNMLLLYLIFKDRVTKPITQLEELRPLDALRDVRGAVLGLGTLGGCICALAVAPYLGIEMWTVSLGFAVALLVVLLVRDAALGRTLSPKPVRRQLAPTLKRMPLGIVPFVLALFITVEALRVYGVTEDAGLLISSVCGGSTTLHALVFGLSSALSANFLNNIPMTVAFVPIAGSVAQPHLLASVLATTIGSNLGANITPIGALAGIMWMSILREKEVQITFTEFVRHGLTVTPVTLLVCLGVLALEFMLF